MKPTADISSSRRTRSSIRNEAEGGGGDAACAAATKKRRKEDQLDDTKETKPKKKKQTEKKKRRGRPPKKKGCKAENTAAAADPSRDVLYLKGAAAQSTTHPGNLAYYSLCEKHYDEFSKQPDGHPTRKAICERIIDEIEQNGGFFRKATGGKMDRAAAVQKTKDRMRQISKPKIRPTIVASSSSGDGVGDGDVGVGENDVVVVTGATNHLYPGNARWRALLRGYVNRYWKDWMIRGKDGDSDKKATAKIGRGKKRPQYQYDLAERMVSIIASRGGRFRNGNMRELSHEEAMRKTHQMFKDLKKELRAGKVFVDHDDGGNIAIEGDSGASAAAVAKVAASPEAPGAVTVSTISRTGCTSVKSTVSSGDAIKKMRKKKKRKKKKGGHGFKKKSKDDEDVDDDNASFDSDMLQSDDDDGDESDEEAVDDKWKDMLTKRPSKRKQTKEREDRFKRRKSGKIQAPGESVISQEEKKRRERVMRRRKGKRSVQSEAKSSSSGKDRKEEEEEEERTEEIKRPSSPEYSLSEYELKRLEKIKRNQERLVELGLAGRSTSSDI